MSRFLIFIRNYIYGVNPTNLHRWCHSLLPNCNNDVILRKIDLANYDNSFEIPTNNK